MLDILKGRATVPHMPHLMHHTVRRTTHHTTHTTANHSLPKCSARKHTCTCTPISPTLPPTQQSDLIDWTALVGSAYLPSTVAPLGLTDTGLPIGVQIVGPFLSDRTTIAFARAIEDAVGGYTPPPRALAPAATFRG